LWNLPSPSSSAAAAASAALVAVVVVVVVVVNAQAFLYPSIIVQVTEYSHSLKLYNLEDDLDSSLSYHVYTTYTMGMEKLTICVSEALDNHDHCISLWKIGKYTSVRDHFVPMFVLVFSGIISFNVSLDLSFYC
jgi:hypothetical protein